MSTRSPQVLLAFDFGMKRIGVAVGQTVTKTTTPLKALHANQGEPDWSVLAILINEWQATAFVVGIPLNMDGSEQFTTHLARQFANQLKKHFKLPVYRVDERLTTKAARTELFAAQGYKAIKEADIDSVAASLILQQWFSGKAKGET